MLANLTTSIEVCLRPYIDRKFFMKAPLYDLRALEGELIVEVLNFKEEGLVTSEGGGEKGIFNISLSMQGIEPWSPA